MSARPELPPGVTAYSILGVRREYHWGLRDATGDVLAPSTRTHAEAVAQAWDLCKSKPDPWVTYADALEVEVARLREALAAIVNEPVSMLLAQSAGLVRLVGPDGWPEDAVPRSSVVVMALRIKDAADMQRAIARDRERGMGQASEALVAALRTLVAALEVTP